MRCTGIFIGFMTALLVYKNISIKCWLAFLLLIPLIVDGGGQYIGFWQSTKYSRVGTGLLAGFGSMTLELMLITKMINIVREFI